MTKQTLEEEIASSHQRSQEILEICREEFPRLEWQYLRGVCIGVMQTSNMDIRLRFNGYWVCGVYFVQSMPIIQESASTPAEALSCCKQQMRAIGEQLINICKEGEG